MAFEQEMAALEDLAAEGGPAAAPGEVVCRACGVAIDDTTGEPVEPVTPENVAQVQEYAAQSSPAEGAPVEAEMGGIPLL